MPFRSDGVASSSHAGATILKVAEDRGRRGCFDFAIAAKHSVRVVSGRWGYVGTTRAGEFGRAIRAVDWSAFKGPIWECKCLFLA